MASCKSKAATDALCEHFQLVASKKTNKKKQKKKTKKKKNAAAAALCEKTLKAVKSLSATI